MSAPVAASGVLLLDKPAGISSAQAIARAKRMLKPSKIGHSGTLDPLATGLLICLLGSATRLAQYAGDGAKTYSGVFRFGITTETDDIEGNVLEEKPVHFTDDELQLHANALSGRIMQIPPRVSAVKIDGKRAYERVRNDEEVELAPRPVFISRFEIRRVSPERAGYSITCSKGTYIRSIARDLGQMLGCGGAVETIRRERSEPFSVTEARPLEEIGPDAILPWQRLFPLAPRLTLSNAAIRALRGGDQRVLSSRETLEVAQKIRSSGEAPAAVLYEDEGGAPAGVLVWNGERLTLGLHIDA